MPLTPATAFLDWLACAVRGAREPAAVAAEQAGDGIAGTVTWLGTAGHVLDYDDTYLPGLAHLSAAVAPAALAIAAEMGHDVATMLEAYADGVEAMATLTAASHPALYDGGWHPTAVAGGYGAAVAAARLIGADAREAGALALLRAGGLRAAFGTDGKALQVGMAAADGVTAARLVAAGARVDPARIETGDAGYQDAFRASFASPPSPPLPSPPGSGDSPPPPAPTAFAEMWIKAWPCCLQTHGAIEAASIASDLLPRAAPVTVMVHPVSRRAAALDDVADGLEAKFSIPYLTAWTLRHGPPGLGAFSYVDDDVRAAARDIRVMTDATLLESEAVLVHDGAEVARVVAALGSPQHPMSEAQLAAKRHDLCGDRLDSALADLRGPARAVLERVGPQTSERSRPSPGTNRPTRAA